MGEDALIELFLALPSSSPLFLIYSPKRALTNSASIFGTSGAGWLMVSAGAGGGPAVGGVAALSRVQVSEPHTLHRNYQRMMEKGMAYPS